MSIKEKIMRIMALALEINPPEADDTGIRKTEVFVSWSPHCNRLSVRIYYGGWHPDDKADEYIMVFTASSDKCKAEIMRILDKIIIKLETIQRCEAKSAEQKGALVCLISC